MMKLLLSAAVCGLFLAAPANAMEAMKCDDAAMTKMKTDMDAMTDPAMKRNKDIAMKHMDMASAAMKDKRMDDCSMQLGMASKSMKLKCDATSMMIMRLEMEVVTDPAMKANKDMAIKQMDLAKASMENSKTDDCLVHMGEAMDAMQKKM